MRFSIIVPFQRGTYFLRDCLESLRDQIRYIYEDGEVNEGDETIKDAYEIPRRYTTEPYRDFEVIIVADHVLPDEIKGADAAYKKGGRHIFKKVTDEQCAEAYEKFSTLVDEYRSDYSVRIIDLQDKTGVAAARNAGIAEAQGDYIYFLDSDDYLYAGALFRIDEAAVTSDEPDLLYGKKKWTFYSRDGYRALNQGPVEEDASEDSDESGEGIDENISEEEKEALRLAQEQAEKELEEKLRIKAEKKAARKARKLARKQEKRDAAKARDEEARNTLEAEEYEEFRRTIAVRRLVYKRKGIGNISALHIAFKRGIVQDNGLKFPEDGRYYVDCEFLVSALFQARSFRKIYRSRYVKRKHNDPVNFPSISQENAVERFDELVKAYSASLAAVPETCRAHYYIGKKFIYYFTGFYATTMRRSPYNSWRTTRFAMMREAMKAVSKESVNDVHTYDRMMLRALKQNKPDKAYRLVTAKLAFRKLKRCIKSEGARRNAFYEHVFLKRSMKKNWIMFECFFGKSYGDNPKAIYEYMAQNYGKDYKFIWSLDDLHKNKDIPYRHVAVRRNSVRYAYYMARSKFFVYNVKQPKWMRKRKGQVFLETWHGTPLKRLAFDMEDNFSAAPGYKKQIYGLTRRWDYMVSPNAYSTDIFRSCFMYRGKMLEYGYPRNDILHRPDREELALKIKKKLGIPLDKKTILYAPTWRDDEYYSAGKYKFTLKLDLPKLKKALGDEYVVLLRTHYYIANNLDITGVEDFAINLSTYNDIADIYLISDICITDYSSVFFDYANLRRPILFYTYDIDKYRDMLRGFYFDMESTVPGPLLYTSNEVIDAIKNIDQVNARFAERYDRFYERFCGWEDGHASENIAKDVIIGRPKTTEG